MRLDKFLSNSLNYSRSEIKKIIKQGKVSVNGSIIKDNSFNVEFADSIYLNNTKISYNKLKYLVLNKPKGVISATKDNTSKTVIDLLDEQYKSFKLFPVGRLDKDTEGLLILTNDGEFAHNSLSPRKHVTKKYLVDVLGILDDDDIKAFSDGVTIDKNIKLKSAKLEILESSKISKCYVYINEGKFHQIKKMFMNRNKKVLYLKRVAFGNFELPNDLKIGEFRELKEDELKILLGDK